MIFHLAGDNRQAVFSQEAEEKIAEKFLPKKPSHIAVLSVALNRITSRRIYKT